MKNQPKEKPETGFNLPKAEEKILNFWKTNDTFNKSLNLRKKGKDFIFYEGPPYANGRPGIHHVLARVVKDVILRYKTMRGYYVPRKAGWDTHGLPVEIAAEKALGLKSKKDIEKYGIERFNEEAKKAVWLYKDEWEKMTERIGYWLDLKNAYVTCEPEYIETLWWTLAQISKRNLLYKGHKVVPWCTRCGTALSSHELALGYKETTDESVYVKFKLKSGQKIGKFTTDDKTYILSWTTTPWTLPGNVALAVGEKIAYQVHVVKNATGGMGKFFTPGEYFISANGLSHDITGLFNDVDGDLVLYDPQYVFGRDLIGLEYEPLFDIKPLQSKAAYKIYPADFVTTTDGTGVVHTAVMYGEDDYKLGAKVGLPQHHTVDEEGKFTKDVPGGLAGMHVKSKETEEKIFEHLKKRGNLLKIEKYTHEYPYCWRCDTPLIYYARTSWFIAMSKLRKKLLASNKKINWIPDYIKEGRFGEWLREVKDWNLSRERYWGAPLPIWECKRCGSTEVVGSLNELSERAGGMKNNYWTVRHGESETQIRQVVDSGQGKYQLTAIGRDQVWQSAEKLRRELEREGEKIDLVLSSDILRAKESAVVVASVLGVKRIIPDRRLREIYLPDFSGRHPREYHRAFSTYESRFEERPRGGESLRDVRARLWDLLQDLEKKYQGKNILLVSHEYPIWMLFHIALGWSEKRAIREKEKKNIAGEKPGYGGFIGLGGIARFDFQTLPRNDSGEVDLHRPYIDGIEISCTKCRSKMRRVKEVADVWYDSGAMPFASQMPDVGSQKSDIRNQISEIRYPADYIAEGMDQTRGWFYTLLAVATALGFAAPYKNVIALGLVNDKFGQKMSKSKGNIVDPWMVIEKHGADAVRWYFYTANPPGEPKNFDEAEIVKAYRKMHLLLWNSLVFYQTYAKQITNYKLRITSSSNILDKWILERLSLAISQSTDRLDKYGVREAAFVIEKFVEDLSRWYIRRSRRRFQKPTSAEDLHAASATLSHVLGGVSKLLAPFCPFFAEEIWRQLGGKDSVHLLDWPKSKATPSRLIMLMNFARAIVERALAERALKGVKVRQPLQSFRIKDKDEKFHRDLKQSKEILLIIADEINVKEVVFDKSIKGDVELDTTITPELKEEGTLRDLVRMIQELRQKAGLKPKDKIVLIVEAREPVKGIISRNEKFIMNEVGATAIEQKKSDKFNVEEETKLDGVSVWIGIRKQ